MAGKWVKAGTLATERAGVFQTRPTFRMSEGDRELTSVVCNIIIIIIYFKMQFTRQRVEFSSVELS